MAYYLAKLPFWTSYIRTKTHCYPNNHSGKKAVENYPMAKTTFMIARLDMLNVLGQFVNFLDGANFKA